MGYFLISHDRLWPKPALHNFEPLRMYLPFSQYAIRYKKGEINGTFRANTDCPADNP